MLIGPNSKWVLGAKEILFAPLQGSFVFSWAISTINHQAPFNKKLEVG